MLQVESWYSWNSITDYSDNIISIKNGYAGRRGAIGDPADANSISAYVKSQDADLDARMTGGDRRSLQRNQEHAGAFPQ